MNKKSSIIIFCLLATILFGWFVYHTFNVSDKELVIESEANNPVLDSINPPGLKIVDSKNEQEIKNNITNTSSTANKIKTYNDEEFEVFDKLEKEWNDEVKTIIGEDHYPAYQEMKSRNEKEKMQAYKEYHNYLRKKNGDNFSYNISEDQSIREKSINQQYLKELLKLIGPSKFTKYTSAKDHFNEKMRRNKKEAIQFEF